MIYWLLTTEYPPFYGGGIGTYCLHTAEMLAGKGVSVTIFINDNSVKHIKVTQQENWRVIRFNPSRTKSHDFLGHSTNISFEFAMIVKHFVLLEGPPDVIESQEYLGIAYYLLNFKALLTDWCKNIPVLVTVHSPAFLYMEYNHVSRYRYPNFWICEMEKFCLVAADAIVSPSKHIMTEIRKRIKLDKQELIIRNPYEVERSEETVESTGAADEILFFGKLSVQKGIPKLIYYFEKIWATGYSKPLTLIGGQDIVYYPEGLEMGDIVKKKFKPYIDQGLLRLEDRITPDKIIARLEHAGLVIVPSEHDNFPYVVLEMLGLGKLLLVSKQGGHAEIIEDRKNGFIFDHNIEGDFERVFFIIEQLSIEEKNLIKQRARDTLQHVSFKKIAAEKIAVIKKLKQALPSSRFPFIRSSQLSIKSHDSKDEDQLTIADPPLEGSTNADRSSIANRPLHLTASAFTTSTAELLSIVIPFYNMGGLIAQTLSSVFAIDHPNFEVIVVNDGSTDENSLSKLADMRDDTRLKIIDLPHSGLAAARNAGAESARGQYLAFLDADDMIDPAYYSKAISVLKHYENVHFVGCWVQYFENSTGRWPAFTPEFPLLLYQNLINSSGLIYKRDSFLKAGINDGRMPFMGWEDYDSVINMIKNNYSGVVIPELLFNYRVRQSSMVRKLSINKKRLLSEYLLIKHSDVYTKFATDLLNLQNANGPGFEIDNPSSDHHLSDNIPFGKKFSATLIRMVKKNAAVRAFAYRIYKMLK